MFVIGVKTSDKTELYFQTFAGCWFYIVLSCLGLSNVDEQNSLKKKISAEKP